MKYYKIKWNIYYLLLISRLTIITKNNHTNYSLSVSEAHDIIIYIRTVQVSLFLMRRFL